MGYAGEDIPKAVFNSVVGVGGGMQVDGEGGRYVGEKAQIARAGMEVRSPYSQGLVDDFDVYEGLLEYGLGERLGVDVRHHPVLVAEPNFNTKERREKLTQVMFETFETPAFFTAKNAVLGAFANGKGTAMVVDTGGGVTAVTPVLDGYVLRRAQQHSLYAGDAVARDLGRHFDGAGVALRPQYALRRRVNEVGKLVVEPRDVAGLTASFQDHMRLDLLRDIKESVCQVFAKPLAERSGDVVLSSEQYELPDGVVLDLGDERFACTEQMFVPDRARKNEDTPLLGLHQMVREAFNAVEPSTHRDMLSAIVLTGGNSLLSGLYERLSAQLAESLHERFKIIASTIPVERRFGVWIGGSVLASLGTYQQMWISAAEYQEHGKSIVERKCP